VAANNRPGELAYGTSGQGIIIHLATALFLLVADIKMLLSNGVEPAGGTPAELDGYVRRDFHRWQKVVRDANIRIE